MLPPSLTQSGVLKKISPKKDEENVDKLLLTIILERKRFINKVKSLTKFIKDQISKPTLTVEGYHELSVVVENNLEDFERQDNYKHIYVEKHIQELQKVFAGFYTNFGECKLTSLKRARVSDDSDDSSIQPSAKKAKSG